MLANPQSLASKVLTASSRSCLASMILTLFNRSYCPLQLPSQFLVTVLKLISIPCWLIRWCSEASFSVKLQPAAEVGLVASCHLNCHSRLRIFFPKESKVLLAEPCNRTGRSNFCSLSRRPLDAPLTTWLASECMPRTVATTIWSISSVSKEHPSTVHLNLIGAIMVSTLFNSFNSGSSP